MVDIYTAIKRLTGRLRTRLSQHKQVIISISALASSGMIATLITMVAGIIQARYIGPEALGYFNKFGILPGYLMFLNLGVFVSLNREYPYYLGKGDKEQALEIVRNSLGWVRICQGVFVLVLGVCITISLFAGDYRAVMTWTVQMVIGTVAFYTAYLGYTYRTSNEFVSWSKGSVITALASGFLLPAVAYFNYTGLCIRVLVTSLVSGAYLHRNRPVKIKPEVDWRVVRRMMAFGFPMAVVGYIGYEAIDLTKRLYILRFCSERTLGLYAFSLPVAAALGMIATSFIQVFTPRIAMLYGSSRNNLRVCYTYALKCMAVSCAAILCLIVVASVVIEPFIRLIAPKYIDAVPIMKIVMWTALIPSLEIPVQLLVLSKRLGSYAITTIGGFLVAVGIVYLAPLEKRTASLIIIAFIIGKLVNVLVTQVAILYNIRKSKEADMGVGECCIPESDHNDRTSS